MSAAIVRLGNLSRRIQALSNPPILAIGAKALELNMNQIGRELDRRGRRFIGYSDEYARRKGVGTHPVDLTTNSKVRPKGGENMVGHMLKEYGIIKYSKVRVILGWTNPENKRKAAANFETREFVGLTPDSRKRLAKYIYKVFIS